MCHKCHVSNDVYGSRGPVSSIDVDTPHEWTTTETHTHSHTLSSKEDTNKVLRVTGKVPPAFVQSIISSLTDMGCSVKINKERYPGEPVGLS
jgi:hypothetical protein